MTNEAGGGQPFLLREVDRIDQRVDRIEDRIEKRLDSIDGKVDQALDRPQFTIEEHAVLTQLVKTMAANANAERQFSDQMRVTLVLVGFGTFLAPFVAIAVQHFFLR